MRQPKGVLASLKRGLQESPLGPVVASVRSHGPQYLWHLLWLERSQQVPFVELRAFQDARIVEILRHANKRSAWYRQRLAAAKIRFDQIRGADDLEALEVLTREDIRGHFTAIKANNADRFYPRRGVTGGTTGIPIEFLRDRKTVSVADAARWRSLRWHGVRFGQRIAEIRFMVSPYSPLQTRPFVRYFPGSHTLFINPTSSGVQDADPLIEHLVTFRPDVIRCGSSTWLAFLAQRLMRKRIHALRPRVVFVGGERLFPDQRKLIESAFGAPVRETYGNWEYVAFGGECERGRLHLDAEVGFVEILKGGRRCVPGEMGDIVATSLWNRSFPFIRYAIGDVGYFEPDSCPCGRGLPTWRVIGGRQKDLLATPDGYLFLPNSVVAMPRWLGKIHAIRFYQETRHQVTAQIVRGEEFQTGDAAILRQEIEDFLRGRLTVSVEVCASLEQTVGGKHRYVVSNVPIEV